MSAPMTMTRESLSQIIQMQPGTESAARAHFHLGSLQLADGEVETATDSYRRVPSSWPRWHARAGFAIARIYETHLDDLDAAAREYRKVISLHPESMSAAQSYERLARLHERVGDPLSAENMRECAMRTFERLSETSRDIEEQDEARYHFAVAARQLQRWDAATEALLQCRRKAVDDKDTSRRVTLDVELGLVMMERDQFESAVQRFKDCLDHLRRRNDLEGLVKVSALLVRCQELQEDETSAKRTLRSLVDFVHKSKDRLLEAQKNAEVAPELVKAYLALDREADARAVRTRLRRLKGDEHVQTLTEVEELLDAAEGSTPAPAAGP